MPSLEGEWSSRVKELLEKIKGFADKATPNSDYNEALGLGLQALDSARGLLQGMQDGDQTAVNTALTEWEDVNRTLVAIGKMDKAIEDAQHGPELMEVLEVIGTVVKIGITFAALA